MKIQELKEKIIERLEEAIKKATGEKSDNLELSFPPDPKLGDFTFECFLLAKQLQKSPTEIAKIISEKIGLDKIIEKAEAAGPYINIKITNAALFSIVEEALDKKEDFGKSNIGKKEKVMVEYLGPNTNKPLHLGHMRNASLGITISKIFENNGYEVVKANIINDRGIHICKSMLAYQKWGENSTPESLKMKSDHFVGHWYVKYNQEFGNNPELENEVQAMLQKWESGDAEILALWKKMNEWVYAGWKETYQKFGIEFDVVNYESETYKLGKDIVEKGLKKGIFSKEENESIIFNLPEKEFGLDKDGGAKKLTLIRPNGTGVYITQDIGTAGERFEKYNLDKLIYVVASEQDYHFKCLFKLLESLGYKWAKNLFHLSYGIVTLPEGRMKSREGNVVDADDLISEMNNLAKEEIKKRIDGLNDKELSERAEKIGIGAIKFYFLRVNPRENIEFNPKESISFDGFTGPYCQYACARISSIIRKSELELKPSELKLEEKTNYTQSTGRKIVYNEINFEVLGDNIEERELIQKIIAFPEKIKKASIEYNPSIIATHIFETAQLFNKFYQKHKVLNAETEELKNSRLALIQAIQTVLKAGLNLLGIETLDKM
ncbi:MAG: arginine--tRNA ligase [Patescibacteria group bacterium]